MKIFDALTGLMSSLVISGRNQFHSTRDHDPRRAHVLILFSILCVCAAILFALQNHPARSTTPGIAKICLTAGGAGFENIQDIRLPATAVFEDAGVLSGNRDDPSSWTTEPSVQRPAFATLEPVVLTKSGSCVEAKVKMLRGPLWDKRRGKASDNHVYTMTDVLDYPVPAQKPAIELGKLIDDIDVKAMLTSDVNAAMEAQNRTTDDPAGAIACLEGAKKLAAYTRGGTGRQTSMAVFIGDVPAQEASYGCSSGPKGKPDLFVSWNGQASPPAATQDFITKAGEYLTGATRSELTSEMADCIQSATEPDADEASDREFRGVKIECQAFARDGGGGSVTIYRRFGAYPVRETPKPEARDALKQASEAIRAGDANRAAGALAFATAWRDRAVPQEVKTFVMLAARIRSLAERCPSWKPRPGKIEELAASSGIDPADTGPEGRYSELVAAMIKTMRAGAAQESAATACEEAKKYD